MPRTTPAIANYDTQSADEVTRRLRKLSQAELTKLESYERQGQGRATVLARIAALRGETPWSGYDDMEADEVNDALKKRDGDTARAVLDYERQHKARTTIIEFAERKRDEAAGSAATTSQRNGAGKSEPGSASKSKRSSASSRRGSRNKSTARSSGAKARGSSRQGSSSGRSTKAAPSRTRARTASRPSAASSSSPRSGKGRQASSRSKSRSSGASRSGSSSGARPSRSAGRAVGAAAKNSREMIGTAARDTGHAVGTAAKKAKGPAVTAGAAAVALGGGVMLGSKLLRKRTILGIPMPGRRSRLSQAAKSISKARNGLLEAGNRADAIGKQVSAVNDEIQRIASGPPKG
jgi:hypothetical protein